MNILARMKKDIKEMPDGSDKQMLLKLAADADFMASELKKLRADIKANGWVETYQNGQNQHGVKKSSTGEVYNTLVKNFRETCALILKYLYGKDANSKTDELDEFMQKNSRK